jgi:hypothetical protein
VKFLLKVLYMPFGLAFGLVGGMAAKQLFGVIWGNVDPDDAKPPSPRSGEAGLPKVVAGAALQAATFAATKAAFDRAGANTFRHLIGDWPAQAPEPETETE